jgi:hypothetical protein
MWPSWNCVVNSPPSEGWQAKPDGVVTTSLCTTHPRLWRTPTVEGNFTYPQTTHILSNFARFNISTLMPTTEKLILALASLPVPSKAIIEP